MKRLTLIIVLVFIQLQLLAQINPRDGKRVYANIIINPIIHTTLLNNYIGVIPELGGYIALNGKIFTGVSFSREVLPTENTYGSDNYNLFFSQAKLALGGMYFFPHRIRNNGRVVSRKSFLSYSVSFGGGRLCIKNQETKPSNYDYYYLINPRIGLSTPINNMIVIETAIGWLQTTRVSKYTSYGIDNSTISGPRLSIGLQIKLLSTQYY